MLFKAIVTVLLFIIHTAIEARFSRWFPSPIYSVAIEGKLICPSYPKGFALVMISNNKKPKPDHRPIAKIYAKFYRAFFLSKMFKHWGRQPPNMGAQPVPELELDNQGQISLSSLPSIIEEVVRQENLNITRVMLIKIALKYAELKNKRKSNEDNMQSLLETTMSSINTLMTNKVRPTFRLPRKHTPTELNAYLEEIESLNVDDYEKINIIISQVHGPTKDAALMIPDKSDFIKFCNQLKDNLYPLQNNRYEAKKELLKIRPYSRETIINFLNRVGAQIQISNETLTNK
uniref:Uncharacterized protein n=1 Tax=Strongyloides papillosus TaxID=174720 RepID=A0A0N5C2Z8_STREA